MLNRIVPFVATLWVVLVVVGCAAWRPKPDWQGDPAPLPARVMRGETMAAWRQLQDRWMELVSNWGKPDGAVPQDAQLVDVYPACERWSIDMPLRYACIVLVFRRADGTCLWGSGMIYQEHQGGGTWGQPDYHSFVPYSSQVHDTQCPPGR